MDNSCCVRWHHRDRLDGHGDMVRQPPAIDSVEEDRSILSICLEARVSGIAFLVRDTC